MSRWRLDPDARDDLQAIYEYVGAKNRTAAVRLIETFKGKFRLLARQPLMGKLRPELSPNLRSFVSRNYVVFYRPTRSGIDVARVIHAARDIRGEFTLQDETEEPDGQ
jgi:toxin ParE1/3/4